MTEESHPDLDHLSDLHAGVLDPAEADEVERHLEHCPTCPSMLDSLVRVQGELRNAGSAGDEPVTMPAEVTDRVTAAVRAEANRAEADAPATSAAHSRTATRTSRRSARSRPARVSRGLAVAAGVAVLAVGGAVAYEPLRSMVSDSDGASTVSGPSEQAEPDGDPTASGNYALDREDLELTEQNFDDRVADAVVPRDGKDAGQDADDAPESSDESGGRVGPDGEGDSSEMTPGTEPRDPSSDSDAGVAQPNRCVEQTLRDHGADAPGGQAEAADRVLDIGAADFDGEQTLLVLTDGSATDTVHAWAIEGCPGDGSVTHDAEITVDARSGNETGR